MMNTQQTPTAIGTAPGPFERSVDSGGSCLGRRGGLLRVLAGRAWLTVHGAGEDRVLVAGESLNLPAGQAAWVGAWDAGSMARLDWRPAPVLESWHERAGRRVAVARRLARSLLPAPSALAGATASLAALAAGAILFGSVSEARLEQLARRPAVIGAHNPVAANGAAPESATADGRTTEPASRADPRGVARPARRPAPGAA
jgi:hypothetical protein